MDKLRRIFTREVRAWTYGVFAAAVAMAVAYGVLTDELATHWLALGTAVIAPYGLALANITPADAEPRRAKKED